MARLGGQPQSAPELEALKLAWLVHAAERLTDGARLGNLDEAFHATLVLAGGNDEIARVHSNATERIRIIGSLDFSRPRSQGLGRPKDTGCNARENGALRYRLLRPG